MHYMTDRKRAEGLGSSRSGTHHHWQMMASSAALLVLVPLFVFTVGPALGQSHDAVLALLARPFPAIVTALTLIVVALHCRSEAEEAIIDYMHGAAAQLTLVALKALTYTLIVAGLFALVKLAL